MFSSKQLFNKRNELKDKVAGLVESGDTDEAMRVEGEIRAIDAQIADVLDMEEAEREASVVNKVNKTEQTFAEKLLGDKASFKGISDGFSKSVPIKDAVSGLETPQIYRRDLKNPVAPPTGFLATILHGATDGDEHFFMTPVLDNKAASWVSGDKPESSLEWKEGTAPLDTVAHWIPIKKQTANRYTTLETIVRTSLMLGLDLKADEMALRGKNPSGITGVCETDGILAHKKVATKNLKDTFAAMKRKVRVATGVAPTHVCLSPYAIEELSEEKDTTDRYLFPDIANGGTIAGLTVVEDVNMTADDKETALVYYAGGASWDVADPEEVTIGLTNSQFIQNEYTVLAEFTAALRVDMPAAFCYCADLGIEADASVEPMSAKAKAAVKA